MKNYVNFYTGLGNTGLINCQLQLACQRQIFDPSWIKTYTSGKC